MLKLSTIMPFVTGHGYLMLHSVGSDIATYVHLKMDKPLECSMELENEHSWYLSKMFQYAQVSKNLHKFRCLICLCIGYELNKKGLGSYCKFDNIKITDFNVSLFSLLMQGKSYIYSSS